jgi:spore maturation protein CgeB
MAPRMGPAHDEWDYLRERQRRREAEARAEGLKNRFEYCQAELECLRQEVRYQLGDALVRAARPSLDTLKLPFRLVRLLLLGLKRRRARRMNRAEFAALPRAAREADGPHFAPVALVATPFVSAPPELRRRNDLRVALVADEFSWWAWAFEADVYSFTPRTWQATLEESPPDLLLVESTWRGVGESWHYQVRDVGRHSDYIRHYALPDLVTWCKQHGVPTVFYNKEDPPNFEFFIDAAALFDHVITSDANCIGAYRDRLGHARVQALPFAAQPRLNNPVWAGPRADRACFAGTWYQNRHVGRQDAASVILRPALDFGLDIYDRNAGRADPNYRWPAAYQRAVRGGLPYAEMLTAYKCYQAFLNVNSVANSPTMCARRVFELLACGTPVISSYSEGIEELLGAELVLMSTDAATTRRHLERVLGDEDYRARLALRGQRKVFSEHTYTHRLQSILDAIGLARPRVEPPGLTMIAALDERGQLAAAWENYRRQRYGRKRLILCARERSVVSDAERVTSQAAVEVIVAAGAPWGVLLKLALEAARAGYVAALHPEHYYGAEYLTDYAHATLYAPTPAIGKASFYEACAEGPPQVINGGHENRDEVMVAPWTLCVPQAAARVCADTLAAVDTPEAWWRGVLARLAPVYSADRFNYVAHGGSVAGDARQVALA